MPDLVGPHEDLCPECFCIAADVVIPSLLSALDEEPGDIVFEESDDGAGTPFGARWSFLEEETDPVFPRSLLEDIEEPHQDRCRPTFQGRPRF